ncbi:WW domain-binding protein 11, partial [Setaria italica]
MRAIHSLAAPPGPPPARPPPRRGTTAASASPLRESSRPQPQPPPPAPPSLASRRAALLALAMVAAPARPFAAAAFSLGIPGPKELLREQKKKSASFLLAPIAASRDTLLKAQALLASPNASAEDAEEVRGRIGAAGRDCVPRQRNSIVAFQSKTGVE